MANDITMALAYAMATLPMLLLEFCHIVSIFLSIAALVTEVVI